MGTTPEGMVRRFIPGVKKESARSYRRLGRHAKDGRFIWWNSPLGLLMRQRKLLRSTITEGEIDDLERWMSAHDFPNRKLTEVDPTRHVSGAEDNVHQTLLLTVERFMARHAPAFIAVVISGFRSYAKQLSLWLAFRAGTGNPANPPGSSKHEATDGYRKARAIDTYIGGVAFWTWVGQRGLRDEAEAMGLRQPYAHEPWHVEHANL